MAESSTSYVPVSDRASSDFGGSLLNNGTSSSSPFPTSSYTPNQRQAMSSGGGFDFDRVKDFLSTTVGKAVAGVTALTLLIVIIVSTTGGGGGGSDYFNNNPRGKMLAANCEKIGDLLFGEPVHQHGDHYYQLVGDAASSLTWMESFNDALHRCHNGKPGYLVAIQSKEENDFVLDLIKSSHTYMQNTQEKWAWIGAMDMKNEGEFEWVTGSSKTDGRIFWKGGSPNNGGKPYNNQYNLFENSLNGYSSGAQEPNSAGEEDCVAMRAGHQKGQGTSDGTWNDENCYHGKQFFIVEFDG